MKSHGLIIKPAKVGHQLIYPVVVFSITLDLVEVAI